MTEVAESALTQVLWKRQAFMGEKKALFVLFLLWHLFFFFHFRLLQHVPFRESKLTHYLQSFFCGRGKVCMIVNINQCASMYDETLNVLKLSAVAQKVCSVFFAQMIKKCQFDPWMMTQKITSDLNRCLKAILFSSRWWFCLQSHFLPCPKALLVRWPLSLRERGRLSVTPARWATQMALTAVWRMSR